MFYNFIRSGSTRASTKKFSKEERKNELKKCDNPKGFTMKQFCKIKKRSKKGERTNEGKDPKREQVKNQKVPVDSYRRESKRYCKCEVLNCSGYKDTLSKASFNQSSKDKRK